jgi:hypothetical protein
MVILINNIINLDGSDWVPANELEIANNLNALIEALSCCEFHFKGDLLYSSSGMDRLFKNLEQLKSFAEDYFLANPLYQLRVLIRDLDSKDSDYRREHRATLNYQYMTKAGAHSFNVNNTLLAEAAEYVRNGRKTLLLNFPASEINQENPVHITIGSIVPPPNILTVSFAAANNKAMLVSWTKSNHTPRKFNLNPKHGENGKNARANKGEKVSLLLCSKDQAQVLLDEAVCYRGTSELFYLDTAADKFMVFKSDNTPDNSYHGYHLDLDDEHEVPGKVRQYLRKL